VPDNKIPTSSVIIPAYNAAGYITRAIESALAQTVRPLEILVVDDGSKDQTPAIVSRYPEPVRLIIKQNGGPASARNLGASQARGDWLALLDADDWWFPEKLSAQLDYATDPRVGMIHCLPDHRNETVPAKLDFEQLWDRNWIINSSVLIRHRAFQSLGGFNEAKELISVEDYNLWIRVAASEWKIITCPQVLVHYTRGIGISSNSERFLKASLFNVDDIGTRLGLPAATMAKKRNEIIFDFGRKALFERDLGTARRLLRRAFREDPTARKFVHMLTASIPAAVLHLRRNTLQVMEQMGRRRAGSGWSAATAPDQMPESTQPQASILDAARHVPATEHKLRRPVLITTIDAEEDFDWTRPFSPASADVTSMRSQHRAHRVMERFGAIPTYMVDYPVASQDTGRAPLKELLQSGACEIGAQLHPWVTPPLVEYVSAHNSYPGNLPAALEFAKIQTLTGELEAAFGIRPRIFRAGRYGVGPNTGGILSHFGYEADSSVVPYWNFASEGGPDFRDFTAHPYWIDHEGGILELPVSASIVGRAAELPHAVKARFFGRASELAGLPSIMARLDLLERIKLTPEGITIQEAKRLVRHMAGLGHKVFVLTYHSPSLEPGNTPYVRTADDLVKFLDWLSEFYDFFTREIGGICATWGDVRNQFMPE
jgi:glycosyltransferase involved in cell wall biosynthesis